jgi:hypothetical protein
MKQAMTSPWLGTCGRWERVEGRKRLDGDEVGRKSGYDAALDGRTPVGRRRGAGEVSSHQIDSVDQTWSQVVE